MNSLKGVIQGLGFEVQGCKVQISGHGVQGGRRRA